MRHLHTAHQGTPNTPNTRRPDLAGACPRATRNPAQDPFTGRERDTTKVMSRPSATHVTQLSSLSLRARTRRPNTKTYVAPTTKNLQARHSDTTLDLSAPLRVYAHAVRFNKSHVTSVAGQKP